MSDRTIAMMIPCRTPTSTTVPAVIAATTNSSRRSVQTRCIPAMSTSSIPIRKTTVESTASGMYCSGTVSQSRTIATMPTVVTDASWLLPPAPSTIWVLVGLPFTTKVPENPATELAAPRPTRSTFSSNLSLYLAAYARERRGALGEDQHEDRRPQWR